MPLFAYKAVSANGKTVTGEIPAENGRHARSILRESGVIPIAVNEIAIAKNNNLPSLTALSAMVRQLGTLLNAGFPADRALSSLALAASDPAMKTLYNSLHEGIARGMKLSEAVARCFTSSGKITFWDEFTAMVQAGEAGGELADVLISYSDLLEKRVAFRRRLQGALFYPLVVLSLAFAVVIFLFSYVVPTITLLFENSQMPLPLPTKILFLIADFSKKGLFPIIGFIIAGFFFYKGYLRSNQGRRQIEKIIYVLPGIGSLLEKAAFARWARTFGSLLDKGVEIRFAMKIAARTARSIRIEDATQKAEPRVASGITLARALTETKVFPGIALEAVMLGESSGTLPKLLKEIAGAWESEVENGAARFADILEPMVLILMGGIVGSIVLAILLPIFEFNSAIK